MKKLNVFLVIFITGFVLIIFFIISQGNIDNKKTAITNPIDGYSKKKAGDYAGAKADFDKAIELDPNNFKLLNERGRCKEELGDNVGALEDYKKAISISSNYAEAYYNMAWCKHKINDKIGACSDWQKSVELNGNGKFELESYCTVNQEDNDITLNRDTVIKKKAPVSASEKKSSGIAYRHLDLITDNNICTFSYVYLNNKPHGRMAKIYYDDFYLKYTVSFTNSSGDKITFDLKESNFTETWGFVYNGGKYELTNNQKGRLYY
jgi:tetratricopeptide (TPR) repeat protein